MKKLTLVLLTLFMVSCVQMSPITSIDPSVCKVLATEPVVTIRSIPFDPMHILKTWKPLKIQYLQKNVAMVFSGNPKIEWTEEKIKYAFGQPGAEGTLTECPVRCWVFHKSFVGVEEQDNDAPKLASMIISPNPSVHNARVSYTLPKSCNVTIRLFDVAGRLVKKLDEGYKEAGTHSLNIDTNELSSGTLFLIIDAPIGCISQRLVIVK